MTFGAQEGERLREERERLGWTQVDAADTAGIRREMWGRYERGVAAPGADVLQALARSGVDIMYLLSGVRSSALTPEEAALLDNYRHVDREDQAAARRLLDSLAQPKVTRKKSA